MPLIAQLPGVAQNCAVYGLMLAVVGAAAIEANRRSRHLRWAPRGGYMFARGYVVVAAMFWALGVFLSATDSPAIWSDTGPPPWDAVRVVRLCGDLGFVLFLLLPPGLLARRWWLAVLLLAVAVARMLALSLGMASHVTAETVLMFLVPPAVSVALVVAHSRALRAGVQ